MDISAAQSAQTAIDGGLKSFTLLNGQVADVTLLWAWAGEPYARLRMAVYRFGVPLTFE